MKKASKISRCKLGFSLAEVLVALTIGAMVLVVMLGIYSRAERSSAAIVRKLDSSRLVDEILQRIAEDIDEIIAESSDTKVSIENKFKSGFHVCRLTILKTIYDDKNKAEVFERIVWQSSLDPDAGGLILYRSHSGITSEDKLLSEQKEDWEKELFIPICSGVTFFKIQVPVDEDLEDKWTSNSLPRGIVVTISFAEPFKTVAGTYDVPDEGKSTRTIAIDRTRKIRFVFLKEEYNDGDKRNPKEDDKGNE